MPDAGDIKSVTIAGGNIAVTTHIGPYDQIGPAYEALHQWMTTNGYEEAGAQWEEYLDDPATTPSHQLRTRIAYPVRSH